MVIQPLVHLLGDGEFLPQEAGAPMLDHSDYEDFGSC